MKQYPVIIIGSGPAGSSCARALTENDIECLVIEKRSLPRHKTCSGILYGQTQELLLEYFKQLPPMDVRCDPEFIEAERVYECALDGSEPVQYVWELPKNGKAFSNKWINIWRSKFDNWLLEQTDAEVLTDTRLVGFEAAGDLFNVAVKQSDGAIKEFTCKYLVGADGSLSKIRKSIDAETVEKAPSCLASYAYYEYSDTGDLREDSWYVYLEKEFGDIISCVHHKDGLLALSVGGFPGTNLTECEKNFVSYLHEQYGVLFGKRTFAEGCSNRFIPPCLGKENILLAGDAGGFIYLNGEGISAAMDSGYRAGKAVKQALENGSRDAAALYAAASADILQHMEYCMKNLHFIVQK